MTVVPVSPPRVVFVFRRQRQERLELYRAGVGPDEMLYGLNHFNPAEFEVCWIEGDDHQWNWKRCLWYPLEVLIARQVKMGFALHIALDHLQLLRRAEVIVSTIDSCGLPIAGLKALGLLTTPCIYISQGLSDRLGQLPQPSLIHRFFRGWYRHLLQTTEQILVLGEGAVEPLVQQLQLPPDRVRCLPFGIDTQFWHPNEDTPVGDYILSVGSDLARDYHTLLQAIASLPNCRLKIVTRLEIAPTAPQVEVASEFTDLALRQLYQQAQFVIIPLQNVAQPSGQSATLQAMACGKAVILTRTIGLWEPKQMRHLENCYLVAPGNAPALEAAITYLQQHPQEVARIGAEARRTAISRYSSQRFAANLANYMTALLQDDESF
ncbi:hypothetical protein DO97_01480 [Neosynechococcus sphagnicola sy1]|uniref:Glycosyltransferase n=1 Tax=Neosynechococcus sphagnicola sy1 TaxID=1497020 RepID=A0A098TLS1_9CYAN|nr:glycosyltransferase [Neosynechococcus sphagnicola]KGF73206.1 hypothetical protein DO97_01480 [Neosynechococcus sphagnicola sy1]